MSFDSRYYAIQRRNEVALDSSNAFYRILSLDVTPFRLNIRQLININAMAQIHFDATPNTSLDYVIHLRLIRVRRGDRSVLVTNSLQRSFVSGAVNGHSEILSLVWTDDLEREGCQSDRNDDDDRYLSDELGVSNCRDRDVSYRLFVSVNTNNLSITNIKAQNRSLTATVFPNPRQEGRNESDFLF